MDYSSLNDQEIKALLMQYDSEMRKLTFQMQVIQSTIQKLHESLQSNISENQSINTASLKNENKSEQKDEIPVPKVVSGIEYPKKRAPKIDLEQKNETKKRGPKPKNVVTTDGSEEKVYKKRGPKPKNTESSSAKEVYQPKKRGPKPKTSVLTSTDEVNVPKKRGPKPKLKTTDGNNTSKKGLKSKKSLSAKGSKRKYTKENPWPDFVLNTLTKYGHLMNSAQLYELAEEENSLKNYGLNTKEIRAMVSRAFHQLSNNKKAIVKFDIKGSKSYNYGLINWMNEQGEVAEKFMP